MRYKGYLAAALCAVSAPAIAGGQYEVQDAAVVDSGACEVELWHLNVRSGGHGTWLGPSCGFGGNQQVALVVGQEREDGESNRSLALEWMMVQDHLEEQGIHYGLLIGTEYHSESSRLAGFQAVIPVSLEWPGSELAVHANVGISHDRDADRRNAFTWGVATEIPLGWNSALVAELSGTERRGERPLFQAGPSVSLADERLVIDLTYGRVLGGERDEHLAVGFTLAF